MPSAGLNRAALAIKCGKSGYAPEPHDQPIMPYSIRTNMD